MGFIFLAINIKGLGNTIALNINETNAIQNKRVY